MTDLVVERAAVVVGAGTRLVDVAVDRGVIVEVSPNLAVGPGVQTVDAAGGLVVAGLVDTHLHLDKTRLGDLPGGDSLAEAMAAVRGAKAAFTAADVYRRAEETLQRCILSGTTRVRTQVEVDPVVGLRGLDGVLEIVRDYAWAVDVEICAFIQDGISGEEDLPLLAEAVEKGATVVGGAPYADDDPTRQIDEIFSLARALDVDVDLHLDLADGPEGMLLEQVCRKTDEAGYHGRVAVGHVTQLSYLPPSRYDAVCAMVADAGVAVTVLPSTDLYLMGRGATHAKPRGVLPLDGLLARGVACSVATNNVLNPFTPYGDGSLLRMANLYANICHVSGAEGLATCLGLVTDRAARVIGAADYGVVVGNPADLVCFDASSPGAAVAEVVAPLWGMKAGRMTFTRPRPELHRPPAGSRSQVGPAGSRS